MPTLSSMQIPIPKSWEEFEEITLDACKLRWKNPDLQMHGRKGQKQDGVDIFGANDIYSQIGVQCKNYKETPSIELIEKEISNAEKFRPKINMLYVAVASETDAKIQKEIRQLSLARTREDKFPVMMLFWNDIIQDLVKNKEVFSKHYPQIKISNKGSGKSYLEVDKIFFNKFRTEILPPSGSIEFIRNNNFAGFAFLNEYLKQLRMFNYEIENPEFEFIDEELNEIFTGLKVSVEKFLSLIGRNTWTLKNPNIDASTVPPEWEEEQPDRFWKVVNEIHTAKFEVCEIYDNLIRKGRKKLLV